jgi:transcriptional regulator with XRE-family HTH domain
MSSHCKPRRMLSSDRTASIRLVLMVEEHKARVGSRIRQAREAKGWSQARLARELPGSTDGPSISRYERGEVLPRPGMLDNLADALDVDTSYFLVAEPEPGTPDLMGDLGEQQDTRALLRSLALEVSRLRAQLDRLERGEESPPGEATG